MMKQCETQAAKYLLLDSLSVTVQTTPDEQNPVLCIPQHV